MQNKTIKRIFDVVLAVVLGVVLLPVVVAIVVAIKIASPGPVLFRQKRLGINGENFLMNKFRKFPSDMGSQGPSVTLQFDSRMTKVGRILERTKLDELPQLWNILIGEMSFVGPRPESLAFSHLFKGQFKDVLNYKPGIFGPNQTAFRNESAMYPDGEDPSEFYERELFPTKAQNDINYFRKASLLGDIKWIASGSVVLVFSAVIWRKSMRTSLIMVAWDIISVVSAWMITHWLKYSVLQQESMQKTYYAELFRLGLWLVPLTLVVVFMVARVYRHPARYFSSTDAYRLLGAGCVVWMLSAMMFKVGVNSTSSLLLSVSCILSIILMCVPRVIYQWWFKHFDNRRRINKVGNRKRIAVIGISAQTIGLCNLLSDGFERANVVGIIADDKAHVRREIHGTEVIGLWTDLDALLARYKIDQLWMGSNLRSSVYHDVELWCSDNRVELVVLEKLAGFSALVELSESPSVYSKLKEKEFVNKNEDSAKVAV